MAQKVFVGLSGGVDSAVSAALLKAQGHEVVGAFIKIWSPEFLECTWREDRLDAMRVCVALGIPFLEVDLSAEYRKGVVDDMITNYQAGITPNPDVLCNEKVKFGAFKEWALAQGADMIATGHYAQIRKTGDEYALVRGVDAGKDQSYFLYRITRDDLRRTLFPVGGMPKRETREIAKRFDLPVAEKHDSQGLCFVGDVSMKDFLARFIELTPGPIVDASGEVLGEHQGAALYTLGQRHGIDIPGGPYFVTRIDTAANTIAVSKDRADACTRTATLRDMHWITREPELPLVCNAAPRYHAELVPVRIERGGESWRVVADEPQLFSPGQSLVLYQGDVCLGGGVVKSV